MSTTTPGIGLPIPTESDHVTDGFDAIADLGTVLDGYLTPDTTTNDYIAVEADADWVINSFMATRVGGLVQINGTVTYNNPSPYAVPGGGNITNDQVMILIPQGDAPLPKVVATLTSGGTGRLAAWVLTPNGTTATLSLCAVDGGGGTITTGEGFSFGGLFIVDPT